MFDEPIPLRTSRFRVHLDDPTFHVAWRGGGRFALTGEVSSEHAVALLRRALPRNVVMTQGPIRDGVEVVLLEAMVPAATPPRLRIFATDLMQRVRQLADNKVEFIGATGGDSQLTILCDARRVTISVPAGSAAEATAARVGASMPHGFRALVDGPVVSVWKNADFFSRVA